MLTLNLRLWSLSPRAMGVRRAIQRATAMLALVLGILAPCAGQQTSPVRVTVVDDQGAAVRNAEVSILELPDLTGIPSAEWNFFVQVGAAGYLSDKREFRGIQRQDNRRGCCRRRENNRTDRKTGAVASQGLRLQSSPGAPESAPLLQASHRNRTAIDLSGVGFGSHRMVQICLGANVLIPRYFFGWILDRMAGRRYSATSGVAREATSGESRTQTSEAYIGRTGGPFATLADIGYASLPGQVENLPNVVIMDGTESLIEGVKDGACHVVIRESSPLTGLFARQFLAKVAKIKPYYEPQR